MLETAITTFVACFALFVVMAVFVHLEILRGRRFILGSVRSWCDGAIMRFSRVLYDAWHHFTQYVIRLGWYYSIHSLLRTILTMLVSVYTYFEGVFEKNRARTKQLRKERRKKVAGSHFSKIAEHKETVSLSQKEQEELLKRKLEQDH